MIEFESKNLLLMQIVNQSFDGILITDSANGDILFGNESACKMLGYSTDEILNLTFLDLHPKGWLETAKIKFKETSQSRILPNIPLLCKDGQLIRADFQDFRFEDGEKSYDIAILTNITDKQQISEALEQSQARNAALLYSIPDYFFIVDKRFVIIDYHAPEINLLYTTPDNFLNKKITEVMPKSIVSLLNDTLEKTFQACKIYEIEYKLEIKGKINFFEARFFPTSENEVMIIVREVNQKTREKQTILKLLEISEEFLQIEDNDIEYQKLTDYALEVSGAEYAILNLLDKSELTFTTVAISGINNYIIKATEILGFDLVGKKWDFDELKHEKIKDNHVTVFNSLGDLSAGVIPKHLMTLIEVTFKLGQAVVVKILHKNRILGDLTLVMKQNNEFKNYIPLEVYSKLIGLLLTRKAVTDKIKLIVYENEIIFNSTQDVLFLIEIIGRNKFKYSKVNNSFRQKTSVDDSLIIGKSPEEFLGEQEGKRVTKIYQQCVDSFESISFEQEFDLPIGKGTWLTNITSVVENGIIKYLVGSSADITHQKEHEAAINDLLNQIVESKELIEDSLFEKNKLLEEITAVKENLEIANHEKDKFFSIIAHDLKSPFSGFLGLTRFMAENLSEMSIDDISEVSQKMKESAETLYQLLDNLLEWSRMKRGVKNFDPEPIDLLMIAKHNINIISEIANQKEIQLSNKIPENVSIYADVPMINTVLRNLLSNAIKFTERGGSVELGMADSNNLNQVGEFVTVYLKDSGIGIPEQEIPNLFTIASKTAHPGTEGEPSTGLGLILCREFIEKHEGEIWVESAKDIGSTFYFSVPKSIL